jgi:hypothetical protein
MVTAHVVSSWLSVAVSIGMVLGCCSCSMKYVGNGGPTVIDQGFGGKLLANCYE